ncbi:tripartite tricarboxylate transporter substrate binding protein [Variovorax rhizosphaerae]|uniref:Tripartite tricarboxylate transporter substrate binding protein n=1 Tax=Variovorax rhizosphaerae TaxID=1836200 RepID=A0ABU8WV73_9BURK
MSFSPVFAEDKWPARPIRMVVPFTAGGVLDIVARTVAQQLGETLGTPVVIDNKAGANGLIGTDQVAKAAPDGYTILMTTGAFTTNAGVYKKLPYDTVKDFAPVTRVARSNGAVLTINNDVPAQNLKEFIALAKAQPQKMNYSSAGQGNTTHLAGALFNELAGTQIEHVAYKGSAPAFQDVISKQITMTFVSMSSGGPAIKAGQVKALAVASPSRLAALPAVPTFDELGFNGMDKIIGWFGMLYPAGTPQAYIDRVQQAVAKTLLKPEVRARFDELGLLPAASTPAEFTQFLAQDIKDQAELIKVAKIPQQ